MKDILSDKIKMENWSNYTSFSINVCNKHLKITRIYKRNDDED